MRIGGGGSTDINLLQSDVAQFRNQDFVVSQDGAFIGGSILQAAVGRFPVVQLFNPLGSGINVLVDGINFSTTSAQQFEIGFHNTELVDDRGVWVDKRSAFGAGLSHIRDENFLATTITEFDSYFASGNQPNQIKFDYPIILLDGKGLAVQALSVTTIIAVGFHGREV